MERNKLSKINTNGKDPVFSPCSLDDMEKPKLSIKRKFEKISSDYNDGAAKKLFFSPISPDFGVVMDFPSPHIGENSNSKGTPSFLRPGKFDGDNGDLKDPEQTDSGISSPPNDILVKEQHPEYHCGYASTSHKQKEESLTVSSPELQPQKQAPTHGHQVSFSKDNLKTSRPSQSTANSSPRCLVEGDEVEEEVLYIGAPLFESSICLSNTAAEIKRESEGSKERDFVCLGNRKSDRPSEKSREDSIPRKRKFKQEEGTHKLPREPANKQRSQSLRVRSNIWTDMEWRRRQDHYLNMVIDHVNGNESNIQGCVSELQDLMTHVSDQTYFNRPNWRHPSDLTCRNYRARLGNNVPLMTLDDWQASNLKDHKRFCYVPKTFERSPIP